MEGIQDKNIDLIKKASRYRMPNVLLISGDRRNVGKTTLGCRIVKELCSKTKVIALKVSPHFHLLTGSLEILTDSPDIVIARETDKTSGKDSSRYFHAGASSVYYVQAKEEGLSFLSEWIRDHIGPEIPLVCESGGLKEFIEPGYSICIKEGFGENFHSPQNEILYNNNVPEKIGSGISWTNNKWDL